MQTTTNLGLKKPSKDDFYNVDDFNYNADKIDAKFGEIGGSGASYVNTTLNAAAWDSTAKTYSLESEYPNTQYDIELNPRNTMTEAQIDAWNSAMITGDATANVFKALGDVPTVSIPVFLKVVKK